MASYLQSLLQSAHQTAFRAVLRFVEAELVPDFIVRRGIRYLLSIRLRESHLPAETLQRNKQAFVDELRGMPIALHTETANEQHYELPTEYFCQVLGRWRKYSSCLYRSATDTLDQAEENMLQLYCDELRLADGHSVLDLGCGWGSFTLYAAEQYPKCKFTAVSNSRTQKQFIDGQAAAAGLKNVTVITADMNDFDAPGEFDRVISVEMFEHMKNYGKLLSKVASWMKPGAIFFCHTFCHKTIAYHFEDNGDDDWMTRHFFTGGTMPSLDLFLYFQQHLKVAKVAYVNGMHYSRCLEAWLALQDQHRAELAPVFKDTYGKEASKWFVYWRLFYLACSELFKYNGGEEWGLAHYTFEKPAADAAPGAS